MKDFCLWSINIRKNRAYKDKTNHKWVELRKLELAKQPKTIIIQEEEKKEEKIEVEKIFDSPAEKLLSVIKKLDEGTGADVENVISTYKDGNCEELIKTLLLQGDVFEVKPGRLKILE